MVLTRLHYNPGFGHSHDQLLSESLAGDVGGTKTLLGLFEPAPRRPLLIAERRYDTDAASSLDAIVDDFLRTDGGGRPVSAAAFGVAGPVVAPGGAADQPSLGGRCESIQPVLSAPVQLLNDVEALAYALDALADDDLLTLQPGRPRPDGAMAVIAAGTGLGQAQLVRVGGRPLACPSEGGHADFAPRLPTRRRAGAAAAAARTAAPRSSTS